MKRAIAALALLCLPLSVHAQYLQNVSTADYSFRTLFTQQTSTRYIYEIQLRNESLFNPNSVYSITGLIVTNTFPVGAPTPTIPHNDAMLPESFLGSVYRGSIVAAPSPLNFRPNYWIANGYNNAFIGDELTTPYGVLGCSVPMVNFGSRYAGDTCAGAGYNGWIQIRIQMDFLTEVPNFDPNSMQTSVFGQRYAIAAQQIATVPEPTTLALTLVGLGVLGVAKRRRH